MNLGFLPLTLFIYFSPLSLKEKPNKNMSPFIYTFYLLKAALTQRDSNLQTPL